MRAAFAGCELPNQVEKGEPGNEKENETNPSVSPQWVGPGLRDSDHPTLFLPEYNK